MLPILVLKIGTSTLTKGSDKISYAKIEDIAAQIVELKSDYQVIVVSSGAIAAAKRIVKLKEQNPAIAGKQALAAIGQVRLMHLYQEIFANFGLSVAQALFTYRDFHHPAGRQNTQNTLNKLLEYGFVPIVNENDTVAVEEIIVGDNDKLAALVAATVQAQKLIIASDIDGLYDANPKTNPNSRLIKQVDDLEQVKQFAQKSSSELGTGGMITKLQAAEICQQNQIEMWIVNGLVDQFVLRAINGQLAFTKFVV